ncbi:MAG: PTS glucose transporter subunit IIA [Ethanoligenens sp.]|uniref:PTS sugar transporter subunit IIA n=1 Tax=Ethanoligenens sp. TaxID=2099655 RepID=UPI0039EA7335
MFHFGRKKNESTQFVATQTGKAVPLSEVPDEAFAQKMLGDGVAILPSEDVVVSPVDGEIVEVLDSLHAYGIHTKDGLDILVHIGINTVELKGEGFRAFVKVGDKVKAGDKLAEVNLKLLEEKGFPSYTPIILTNMDAVKSFETSIGDTKAGETVVITYQI